MRCAILVCGLTGCSFNAGGASIGGDAATGLHDGAVTTMHDAPVIHPDARPDAPPDAHTCSADFTAITGAPTGSLYKIYSFDIDPGVDASATWTAAKATCISSGGYLAIPDRQAELDALNTAIAQNNSDPATDGYWVGLTDAAVEGTWLTVVGGTATFLPWGPAQPNGGTAANCAIGFSSDTGDQLYDEPCSEVLPFACECEP